MIRAYVEPSGESPALAREETVAAAVALGGRAASTDDPRSLAPLIAVELPARSDAERLGARLGLSRRTLLPLTESEAALPDARSIGDPGRFAVRRLGRPSSGGTDPAVLAVGQALVARGGTVDLDRPSRRFWIVRDAAGGDHLMEEAAATDRRSVADRRMPRLPFQRPVSLPPKLGRAAVNLARVRDGDLVVDPFLGTGALLVEAGLLGAQLCGVDADPEMVRGALRNFAHFGLSPRALVEGDAGTVELAPELGPFAAVVTDPPYGRASRTGGEEAAELVGRVLPRWAERVRAGGRVVVVLPGGPDPLSPPWRRVVSVPVRVHRSLTREFRVYER